ncbi:MAG: hypothetical protein IJE72_06005 [Clostridia bacterium]|nr:hypothetical protein [Clostridia bacterium]
MSKKKQPPKMPVKKEIEIKKLPEKKPAKGIIIAAAAVILIAAVILTAVFVVKPLIDKNKETTTDPKEQHGVAQAGGYDYVDYRGSSLPKEFVDILNQAELDRKSACKEYGTALEVGDVKISHPEFLAYYYDMYSLKTQEVQASVEQKGTNMTGYDPKIMPDAQNCLNRGYTWAEEFTRDAIAAIQENYEGFDKALETGIKLTDDEVTQLINDYNRIEIYSKVQNKTYEELFANVYSAGYTEAMFKSREIMLVYKQKYQEAAKQKFYDSYADAELEKKLNANKDNYTVIVGRVYPIEGEYDAVEVSKVSNEKEFLEYANNNHPRETYVAETRTLCNYISKEIISSTYGPEVGEWMFSAERVPGEIAVIEGQLFKYLVYIEEPAYFSVSKKIMFCGYDYYEGITDQEKNNYRSEIQTLYDEWQAGGEKKESFAEICLTFNESAEYDVRVGDFFYTFEEWIFDEARKPGDHTFIESDVGCCIFYFVEDSVDDYDWKVNMKTDMSEADYLELYEEEIEENYGVKRKESVIIQAQKDVNATITRKLEEEKNK